MVTYGTTDIPSDIIDVTASSTVQIGLAFNRTLGLVGGMDTANGSASAGVVQEVSNPTDAANLFGQDSELHNAVQIAVQYPVDTMYAVGLQETTVTDEQQSSATGTLDNSPIFDPNLHGDESITVDDTGGGSLTVQITYESAPSQPTETDTVKINPLTGEYAADSSPSGANYEFDYTYPSDVTADVDEVLTEHPRSVAVGTETESHGSHLATELEADATSFNFGQGFIGTEPAADPADADAYASGYSDSLDSRRLSVVGPPRGYTDADETEQERTVWGVAAAVAGKPLGDSLTAESLRGYESLRTDLSTANAGTLIDSQVMPLIDYPPVTVAKDMTTSTTTRFERVFSNQIVDEAVARVHDTSQAFVGELNTAANRRQFNRSLRNQLLDMQNGTPSLLDAFAVNVSEDASVDTEVDVEIGLKVVDTIDTVDVEVAVGDVIEPTVQ